MIQLIKFPLVRTGILSIAQQIIKYRALDQWFQTPQGMCVEEAIAQELMRFNRLVRGKNLLQLGACGDNAWLDVFKPTSSWIVSPDKSNENVDFISLMNQLPLDRNCIDIVIAPLSMEACTEKNALIDEIDRILKPMGFIIMIGINPFGLWSLAAKLGFFSCFGEKKPIIHSPLKMNRLFLQRGYRQCTLKGFWYIPPFKNKQSIKRLSFLNEVGKMLWPFPAGFYFYIAQKYEAAHPDMAIELNEKSLVKDYKSGLQPVANLSSELPLNQNEN
ncbi:class I SAM-dependent methyltransferase [Legionella israelensis]|nr:class I SAM-dependent methyltransferase [Legionella israelensis]